MAESSDEENTGERQWPIRKRSRPNTPTKEIQIQGLVNDLNDCIQERDQVIKERNDWERKYESLSRQGLGKQTQLDEKITALENEVNNLTVINTDRTNKIKDLVKDLRWYQQQAAELEESIRTKNSQITNLQTDLQAKNDELVVLQNRHDFLLSSANDNVQKTLDEASTNLQYLQAELNGVNLLLQERDRQCQHIEDARRVAVTTYDALRAEYLEAHTAYAAELTRLTKLWNERETEMTSKHNDAYEALRVQYIQDQTNFSAELDRSNTLWQERDAVMTKKFEEAYKEYEALRVQYGQEQTRLNALLEQKQNDNQNSTYQAELITLSNETTRLTKKLEEANEENRKLLVKNTTGYQQFEQLRALFDPMETQIRQLELAKKKLQQVADKSQADAENSDQLNRNLTTKVTELELQVNVLSEVATTNVVLKDRVVKLTEELSKCMEKTSHFTSTERKKIEDKMRADFDTIKGRWTIEIDTLKQALRVQSQENIDQGKLIDTLKATKDKTASNVVDMLREELANSRNELTTQLAKLERAEAEIDSLMKLVNQQEEDEGAIKIEKMEIERDEEYLLNEIVMLKSIINDNEQHIKNVNLEIGRLRTENEKANTNQSIAEEQFKKQQAKIAGHLENQKNLIKLLDAANTELKLKQVKENAPQSLDPENPDFLNVFVTTYAMQMSVVSFVAKADGAAADQLFFSINGVQPPVIKDFMEACAFQTSLMLSKPSNKSVPWVKMAFDFIKMGAFHYKKWKPLWKQLLDGASQITKMSKHAIIQNAIKDVEPLGEEFMNCTTFIVNHIEF